MDNRLVTCTKDGWVSFPVSKEFAEQCIEAFNAHYLTMPKEERENYWSSTASLSNYTCMVCGGSTFRPYNPATDKDIDGHTINPVVYEEEKA